MEARFVSHTGNVVVVETIGGRRTAVSWSLLSEGDKNYVRALLPGGGASNSTARGAPSGTAPGGETPPPSLPPEARVAKYFDDASGLVSAPGALCPVIRSVLKGFPADRAGMKAGDRLIGVDGVRVRTFREYKIVQLCRGLRDAMSLTLGRGDAILKVEIPHCTPIRRCGFVVDEGATGAGDAGMPWNLTWEEMYGQPPPRVSAGDTANLPSDLTEGFGVSAAGQVPRIQPFVAMWSFPPRAVEAIARLAVKNDPADREWVVRLLRVFTHMVSQQYSEAQALMAEHRMTEKKVDPFLDRLLLFYKAVIEHPVSEAEGVRLDLYQVDAPFFALCYPYPAIPEKAGDTNAADAAFQDLLRKTTSGLDRLAPELSTTAYTRYGEGDSDSETDTYVKSVMRAVVDMRQHGGWPYRSWLMYNAQSRQRVLRVLRQRLEEAGGPSRDTAFAALAPSLIEGDSETFKRAYAAAAQGFRESACANTIIGYTLGYWSINRENLKRVQMELDRQWPRAPLYTYMMSASPSFAYAASWGYCWRSGDGSLQDLGSYCEAAPWVVVRALERPIDRARFGALLNSATTDPAADVGELLDLASLAAATDPTFGRLDSLINRRDAAGAGPVCEALTRFLVYQSEQKARINAYGAADRLKRFIAGTEDAHYAEACQALTEMKDDEPSLAANAAVLYREAGVPSVCLLLARKLKQAGCAEAAQRYLDQALGFYAALEDTYGQLSEASVMAYRDLASTPGFEACADAYRPEAPTDGGFVLMAVVESYRGNAQGSVDNLINSVRPRLEKAQGRFLYDGVIHTSVAHLRNHLLGNMLTGKMLSDEQTARLKATPGIDLDAALNTVRK